MKKLLMLVITVLLCTSAACGSTPPEVIILTATAPPSTETNIPEPTPTIEYCNEEIANQWIEELNYLIRKSEELLNELNADFSVAKAKELLPQIYAIQEKTKSLKTTPCIEKLESIWMQLAQKFVEFFEAVAEWKDWDTIKDELLALAEQCLAELEIVQIWLGE